VGADLVTTLLINELINAISPMIVVYYVVDEIIELLNNSNNIL
jgi:hypothetical protein